jgi:hypothetical protein
VSKCTACGKRTTATAGRCQRCKSLRHHGYKRVKAENLIVDQAGGAWWIWDARGNVLVAGKPTKDAAVIALGAGDVEEDEDDETARATKKTHAQIEAEIAEALRARKWQEQVAREDRERRARLARTGPTPAQIYDEHAADLAAGVLHGEQRGRAREFRRGPQHAEKKIASATEALRASEYAKRLSDDAYSPEDHRAAVEAHRRAGKLHKSDPTGAEAGWLHDLAASNHRQAANARTAEGKIDPVKATRTKRSFEAYQEKITAAREHGIMAEEYARQALAAAKKRAQLP